MALSWNHRLGWFAGMQGFNWAGVGFLLIAVGIASFSLSLKCPACGQTPTAGGFRGRARDSGVHFRPDSCPRCGAIFREQL